MASLVFSLMAKGYAVRITQPTNSLRFQDFSLTINIAANGERNHCYSYRVGQDRNTLRIVIGLLPEQGRIAVDDRADVQIVNVSREPLAAVVSGAGTFAAHVNSQAAARATGLVGSRTMKLQVVMGVDTAGGQQGREFLPPLAFWHRGHVANTSVLIHRVVPTAGNGSA